MSLRATRTTVSLFIIIPVIVILFVLGLLGWKAGWWKSTSPAAYQAVFLTNGQVYFGKVARKTAQFVTLEDIYYLRSVERLQEPQAPIEGGKAKEKKGETPQPTEPELTLVKLGQELHGPTDRMEINRDHILFIEDLQNDGKVVTAIKQYRVGK